MLYGTIATYFDDKQFGFNRSDHNRDVFFTLRFSKPAKRHPRSKPAKR